MAVPSTQFSSSGFKDFDTLVNDQDEMSGEKLALEELKREMDRELVARKMLSRVMNVLFKWTPGEHSSFCSSNRGEQELFNEDHACGLMGQLVDEVKKMSDAELSGYLDIKSTITCKQHPSFMIHKAIKLAKENGITLEVVKSNRA
jgi:hypothetical protein